MADASSAAANLSNQGTISGAYRRSVYALQSVFGVADKPSTEERQPLLNDSAAAGPSTGAGTNGHYGSVLDLPPHMRVPVPKKVIGPLRVEAKVWFANERTWISWLRVSVLLGSFALALFNSATYFDHNHQPGGQPPVETPGPVVPASPNAQMIERFGFVYAGISILTLLWGLFSYQRRVSLIKNKWHGHFDDLIGPPLICIALFVAVLLNFIVRVQQHNAESNAP